MELREDAVSITDAGHPLGNSRSFLFSFTFLLRLGCRQTCAGANAAPATKARGFTP